MNRPTLYARQEPTRDEMTLKLWPKTRQKDTVIYKDPEAREIYAVIPWHRSNRPMSRKSVTLNCFKWDLVWID